jgi:hypothetical protein
MSITKNEKRSFTPTRSFWTVAINVVLVNCLAGSTLVFAQAPEGRTYYTRSIIGKDNYDGLSPKTAWQTVSRAKRELGPGDTLIIGPGLYREGVQLSGSGLPGRPLRIFGDSSGKLTGDPPGPVVMTGAIPIEETIFKPEGTPGVFMATISDSNALGVVEMDGSQHRYRSVKEPVTPDIPHVERVRKERSSFWFEKETSTLYIHTSDERPPTDHELELIRSFAGFYLVRKPHVWVSGLTFRHFADAGVHFRNGSDHGRAFNNVAFGSRQGFRIQNASQVQILRNVMFRNENAGAYFLRGSQNGLAQGNFVYENAVGLRFGSQSNAGAAIDNLALDNSDAGLSFEKVLFQVSSQNNLKGNTIQLRLLKAAFFSDNNCYESETETGQLFAHLGSRETYLKLSEFSAKFRQDVNSRVNDCATKAEKVDVAALHAETLSYPQRAQEILGEQ